MKKQILKLSLVLALGAFAFSSCVNTQEIDEHEHIHEHNIQYQCPMKCDGEVIYDHIGTCPVCDMDLKETEK